jgi:hypothetical protein
MGVESGPKSDYTRTWSPSGEIEYAKLADGTRLRYLKAGSGPTALILLHAVRTQLDQVRGREPSPGAGQRGATIAMMAPLVALKKALVCRGKGLRSVIRALWGPQWTRLPRLVWLSRRKKYCHNVGRASAPSSRTDATAGHWGP